MKRLLLLLIGAYQRFISPALPRRCRYEPTCSAYAAQAVRELGPVRGTIVAAWRLARCNPLTHGGLDPLHERTLFRDAGMREFGERGSAKREPAKPATRLGRRTASSLRDGSART